MSSFYHLTATSPLTPPHNLPVPLTDFIGRQKELAELEELLLSHRLVTLTGVGGVGKTRLALQLASNTLKGYRDGAWFIDLAPLDNTVRLTPTLFKTLGLPDFQEPDSLNSLLGYLENKQLLLILDNCEHLITGCAALAEKILQGCPRLKIVATSREALRIEIETAWRVPPYALPPEEAARGTGELEEFGAVHFFCEKARFVLPSFKAGSSNRPAIVQICRSLDGIPLALELAATRLRLLSLEEIAANLKDRFQLLSYGNRSLVPRQQTLKALIDWSYNLLLSSQQVLLNRLSTFKGGWTLDGARAIAALAPEGEGASSPNILDLMQELLDKSLVVREEVTGPEKDARESRYRLLETIRDYAEEKLVASGESFQIRGRHLDYFLGLAEEALPKLRGGEQVKWLNRLEREQDNFRAALNFARMRSQEPAVVEKFLRLAAALWPYWQTRGYFGEGNEWLEKALSLSENNPVPPGLKARVLNGAGVFAHNLRNYAKARTYQEESLNLCQQIGDKKGIATAINDLGWLAVYQLQPQEARGQAEQSLALARENSFQPGVITSLLLLGVTARLEGKLSLAWQYFEEGYELAEELGDIGSMAGAAGGMVRVAVEKGEFEKAKDYQVKALYLRYEEGNKLGLSLLIAGLARAAFIMGYYHKAARLLGASEVLLKASGSPPPPPFGTFEVVRNNALPVDHSAFEQALNEGREMPVTRIYAEALDFARSLSQSTSLTGGKRAPNPLQRSPEPQTRKEGIDALTGREKEVLRLVARGLTDARIAEELSISPRTVHAHLRTIFSKLSISTRSAAARIAVERGLL